MFNPRRRVRRSRIPRSRRQIKRVSEYEDALRKQAERKAIEAETLSRLVRLGLHVLLVGLTVAIGVAIVIEAQGNSIPLRPAIVAAGAWGGLAAAIHRTLGGKE